MNDSPLLMEIFARRKLKRNLVHARVSASGIWPITLVSLLALAVSTGTADDLALADPKESPGAHFGELVHEFRAQRVPSYADGQIIFGFERHAFSGNTQDLNRFLGMVVEFPNSRSITVIFCGPDGGRAAEPLTPSAAKSGVDYDWQVTKFEGDITILVPLAARIPFSLVQVPAGIRVAAGSGAPQIATTFARLHNALVEH